VEYVAGVEIEDLPPEVQREAEDVAAQLLARFPAAILAGGGEEAIMRRLSFIIEHGEEEAVAGLQLLYPGEVEAARAAGLDEVTAECLLWAAYEADIQQAQARRQIGDRVSAKQSDAAKRKRAQAKASRRANRRR